MDNRPYSSARDRPMQHPAHDPPRDYSPGNREDPLFHMREQMDRDRDAFFNHRPFTNHPNYHHYPPGWHDQHDEEVDPATFFGSARGFPQDPFPIRTFPRPQQYDSEFQRPEEGGQQRETTIPIRVIHERRNRENSPRTTKKHPSSSRNTTQLPARIAVEPQQQSPRLERAQSEPPKRFHQLLDGRAKVAAAIPEHDQDPVHRSSLQLPENPQSNLCTSASSPVVPTSQEDEDDAPPPPPPPRRASPGKQGGSATAKTSVPAEGSGVRHIPIFVEGRGEAVKKGFAVKPGINEKELRTPSHYYPQPARRIPSRNVNEKRPDLITTKNDHVDSALDPTSPVSPPEGPIPMGFDPNLAQPRAKQQEPSSPMPAPQGQPIPLPCSPEYMQQTETEQKSDQSKPSGQEEQRQPGSQPEAEKESKNVDEVAMGKLQRVAEEVKMLTERIENFSGDKKDKEYLYLDDMLTRHLCALDAVDACGRDDIRQIRRDSIRKINRCLSLLDSKARKESEDNSEIVDALVAISVNDESDAAK